MAETVNLRRARKAKARQSAETAAAANRAAFGRSKSARQATAGESERARRQLEGHRRLPQLPDADPSRHGDD
jgi:hypothetical protein